MAASQVVDRLLARTVRDPDTGCWLWCGARQAKGYGTIKAHGSMVLCHRVTHQHFIGPIPEGLEPDHLCRVRECCNPWHLELVTHRVNVLRGQAPNVLLHLAGRCKAGHPLTDVQRHRDGRVAYCRTCRRAQAA